MINLKVLIYSLLILSSPLTLGEDSTFDRYVNDSSSSFRIRRYDDFFTPKVDYIDIQNTLESEEIILDKEEIDLRNIDFNEDINESGINREIGGDIVGNGGGSLEHFAYYFFYNLPSLIESSLSQTLIYFDKDERLILQAIRYAFEKMEKENKFVFAKGDEYGSFFFNSSVDHAPRLAKTGFDISYPIYINIERAYEMVDEDPRLWIGLLIHELGHQIGFADHTFLDQLGNKVIAATSFDSNSISVRVPDGKIIKLTAQNYAHRKSMSDLYITMGHSIMSVERWMTSNLLQYSCQKGLFHDVQIENLHWQSRGEIVTQGLFRVKALGWMVINCKDQNNKIIESQTRDIEVTINVGVGSEMISGKVDLL